MRLRIINVYNATFDQIKNITMEELNTTNTPKLADENRSRRNLLDSTPNNQIYYSKKMHDLFCSKPCRICGQDDHTMLFEYKDSRDRVRYEYSCPVAYFDHWNLACSVRPRSAKYHICPSKLALHYGYQVDEILIAGQIIFRRGFGKFMKKSVIHELIQKATEICEEERCRNTFTRDISRRLVLSTTSEDDQIEDDLEYDL
jgi:hypothetical protein